MVTFWKLKPGRELKPRHSIWKNALSARRPFKDSDKDGVIDMFDCQPHNKKKQDEEEKTYKATIYKKSSPALRAVYPKVKKETIEKYKSKQPKGEVIEVEED